MGEARALYNIGNVFHAKGKQQLWGCSQEPGELPPDVRDTLQKATSFYEYVTLRSQNSKWPTVQYIEYTYYEYK